MSSQKAPLEIERKWLVKDWPKHLNLLLEQTMRQGYVSVHPTVRIREENTVFSDLASHPAGDHWILCFKSSGLLSRKEIEIEITKEQFEELEDLIQLPLIEKTRRTYLLKDGRKLEVNLVDEGLATSFMYAEIEFESESDAESFDPAKADMEAYLSDDVTNLPGESMGAYWEATRLKNNPS